MPDPYYGPSSELSPSDIYMPPAGATTATQAADNSGNTVALTGGNLGSTNTSAAADNSGNTGALTMADTSGFPAFSSLNDVKKFISDNKELLGLAGAAAGIMSPGAQYGKTGYQGGIPLLAATRNMVTAPPTRAQGYRPGAGGINYGGDVTYSSLPSGTDPFINLNGNSGTAAGANLTTDKTAAADATAKTNTKTGDDAAAKTVTKTTTASPTDWRKGLSDQQYLAAINQYIASNPGLSTSDLVAAMAKFGVSQTDLQTALGQNKNLSAADIYALSHGMGLKEANAQQTTGIQKFVQDNPYATAQQIKDAIKASGVNTGDINEALSGTKLSGAIKTALTGGMGVDQLYKNILDYQAANHTPDEIAAIKAKSGVTDEDIAAAQKYATEQKYTPTVQAPVTQAAVPEHNLEATIHAIVEQQKALQNQSVDQNLVNLGLDTTQQTADLPVAEMPISNTYSYDPYAEAFAAGGMAQGRYLQGGTDGMADEIPAQIGEDQPAALSHGEFVIPADVVSHLGNGNSDAGAKKLYSMMDKIRMARTGNKKQGKKINPDKFMPGGLAAAYAAGGAVKKFSGENTSLVTANNTASATPGIAGVESNLSNWAGPYVTNMLGQGQALANMPYQSYMGPLTAGESDLQTNAFKSAGDLSVPSSIGNAATTAGGIATKAQNLSYKPTTSSFDTTQAQTYMNPYLQASLNPQLDEARRQSQITQTQNAAKLTGAGAFGGSRQAIMDAETQRNLGTNLANITGQGYNTAYTNAMSQFNADQARKAQEAQFGATYGLQGLQTGLQGAQAQGSLGTQENQAGINNLNAQLMAGAQQRGIESEGIAADKAQFEEARANPYKMVQFQQSLLQGLPLDAKSYQGIQQSDIVKAAQGATTVNQLLKNLGLIS